MNTQAPYVTPELEQAAARTRTEAQARAQRDGFNVVRLPVSDRVVRLATQLNALIRKADADLAEKVGEARNHYAMLLRRLPWDFQRDRRDHEMVVFCEELFGNDAGEAVAWDIMCRGNVR